MMKPDPNSFIVKITLYKDYHVDEVVYYRYEVPFSSMINHGWYFEYLAARLKVRYPKRKVDLYINKIGADNPFLAGKYFIEKRTQSLLDFKRHLLERLRKTKFNDDLFGNKSVEVANKIAKLTSEIEALERGEVTFWYPETYGNTIKKHIS